MDLTKLRTGEKLAGVSGIALFVFLFFKWYGFDVPEGVPDYLADGASASGWQAYTTIVDLFLILTIVAAVGLALLSATQRSVALPVSASVFTAVLGALATLWILFKVFIDKPGPGGIDLSTKIGAYLGLISALGIAVGGWLAMKDEGTSFGELKDAGEKLKDSASSFTSSGEGSQQSAPPPSSPPPAAPSAPEPPAAPPPPPPESPPPAA